jgi:hypothetical protein
MNTAVAPSEDAEQPIETHERLPDDLDTDTLRKFFTLTPSDLEPVEHCRGPINRLGFAVQLCVLGLRQRFMHFPHTTTGLASRTREPAEVVCAGD